MRTRFEGSRRYRVMAAAAAVALLLAACGGAGAGGGQSTTQGANDDGQGDEAAGGDVELRLSSFLGPGNAQGEVLQWLAGNMPDRTDGAIEVEPFWEAALFDGTETLSGVASGRAELGHMTASYNPAELPLTQIISVPFVTDNMPAMQATFNDLYESNDAFRAEWDKTGVRVLSFIGVPPTILAAANPVEGLDWLEGKQIRATGFMGDALSAVGANAVALEIGEVYEAIQRGVVDGYTSMILDVIPSTSLHEVAPHIVQTGVGVYTINMLIMDQEAWDGLSGDQQDALQGAADELAERYLDTIERVEDEACQEILDEGGEVSVFDESEVEEWESAVGDDLMERWASTASEAGAENVDGFQQAYLDTVEQYEQEYGDYQSGAERCAAQ